MDYLIMREIGKIARCFQTISDIEFREIGLEKGQYILVVGAWKLHPQKQGQALLIY